MLYVLCQLKTTCYGQPNFENKSVPSILTFCSLGLIRRLNSKLKSSKITGIVSIVTLSDYEWNLIILHSSRSLVHGKWRVLRFLRANDNLGVIQLPYPFVSCMITLLRIQRMTLVGISYWNDNTSDLFLQYTSRAVNKIQDIQSDEIPAIDEFYLS